MTQQDPLQEESLEETLKHIQEEKQGQEPSDQSPELLAFQETIAQLEKDQKESLEIAKKAQYDYMNLKIDFDRLQRMSAEKEKSLELDALVKYMKKLLPVIDQLHTSLNHVEEGKQDDPFVKGIIMVYDSIMKTLAGFGIKPIDSLGLEPDGLLHEPLSAVPVDDEAMKGKIVQVFQQGFYVEKDGQKIVILPSKVVVGN